MSRQRVVSIASAAPSSIGLRTPDAGADVAQQRVLAGERGLGGGPAGDRASVVVEVAGEGKHRIRGCSKVAGDADVASITTCVTPSSSSRSASNVSERVIVEYVATSCRRRPPSPGTLTQHTTSALPTSRAATRSISSSSSWVSPSTSASSRSADQAGWPREPLGQKAKLILVLEATLKDPRARFPPSDQSTGSSAKNDDVRDQPPEFSPQNGPRESGIND
jgi:hypothetical protein